MPVAPKRTVLRINGGGVKALNAENCHIDIFAAAGIDSIGVFPWPDIDGNHHSSALEFDRPAITDAQTRVAQLVGRWARGGIGRVYRRTVGKKGKVGSVGIPFVKERIRH